MVVWFVVPSSRIDRTARSLAFSDEILGRASSFWSSQTRQQRPEGKEGARQFLTARLGGEDLSAGNVDDGAPHKGAALFPANLNGLGGVNVSDTTTGTCIRSLVGIEPPGIAVEHFAQIGLDFSPSRNRCSSPLPSKEGVDDCRPMLI
jgi:hypothetical protein